MLRLTRIRSLQLVCGLAFTLLIGADPALSQSGTKSADSGTPAAAPDSVSAQEAEGRGWLFRSSLLNIGKPEIKAPAVEWNAEAADQAAAKGQSRLMTPVYRVRDAAKGAMARTRSAWNGMFEKMKFRGDGGAPPMFAKWFGGEEEPAEEPAVVASQPTGDTLTR